MSWTNTNGDTIPGPTEGNDIYISGNPGTPLGPVNALGGNDTLSGDGNLAGGTGDDSIVGGPGRDTIFADAISEMSSASAGNDVVDAGAGDDIVYSFGGADTLEAGSGNDLAIIERFVSTDLGFTVDGAGRLTSSGGLVATGFEQFRITASFGNDTILSGQGDDLLFGGGGADTIAGNAGNDWILGQEGNDTLSGGAGDDTLDGGSATDTADYSGETGGVTVTLDAGNDGTATGATIGTDTLFDIENVIGGAGNDSIVSTGGITANHFEGRAGNDTLSGGAGDDTLDGGADTDTADYSADTAGVTVGLNTGNDGIARGATIGTDVLTDIENVIGGAGADFIVSNSSAALRLDGGGGNDTLLGGSGNDTISGGAGNDVLDGWFGTDTADYSDDTAGVTVTLDASNDGTARGETIGTDTLTAIENVIGGAGADSIVSTGGITANRFEGRAGNDTLSGAGGNDTLDGGTETDTADYSADTAGVTVALDAGDDGTATGTTIGSDILTDIENIIGGAGNDSIVSTAGTTANRFEGGAGNDVLRGGGGTDTILGDGGRDTLEGGEDYDVIRGGDDADLLTDTLDGGNLSGEAGNDTITVTLAGTFIGLGTVARGGSGDDLVTATGTGIQTFVGRLSTSLYGDEGNDTLVASSTNDPIFGGDQLYGGTGDDSLVGSLGINIIEADEAGEKASASAGDDVVDAGAGDDSVYSYGGADTLEGGIGNDLAFIERAVTTDLGVTIDGAGVLTSTEGLRATGFERFDIRLGAGNDTILGGAGNDLLSGGAGADTIAGNAGDDRASGQAGNDTLSGGAGSDILDGGADTDTADYSADNAGVTVTLDAGDDGTATGAGIGSDILTDIENIIGGAGNDSIASTDGPTANRFEGGAGIDTLDGGAGRDTLDGGAGFDFIRGGDDGDLITDSAGGGSLSGDAGDDTIAVTLAGASIVATSAVSGGAGNDLITATGTGTETPFGLQRANLFGDGGNDTIVASETNLPLFGGDDLNGGTGDDSLLGSLGSNFIFADDIAESTSGAAGTDIVDAGAGDDIVRSFGGADTLEGGSGFDLVTVDRSIATDLGFTVDGAGVLTSTEGLLATGFERFSISLGAGNDTIISGQGNDVMRGGAGADIIAGNAGDDAIAGQAGNDTLSGGAGNDTLNGGADTDTADYSGDTAGVTVVLNAGDDGTATGASAGTDTLTDIENVIGGTGADSIASTAGTTANRFEGGAGNDTLDGGAGNDTLLGGEGDDFVLGGAGDDSIVATPGRDTIEGQAGNDVIDTGEDDDLVRWRVGDGNDVIAMGSGNDTLDLEGWTGSDTDFWSVNAGGAGAIYTYDDGAGSVFTLTTSGVETVTCFAPGTRILTPRGEVPVEQLRAGDLVVAPGRGAPVKPVRWVGHTRVDIAHHRDKRKVAPVLIRAGALGAGVPARDLRVSPEHAFLLDGRLVPAHLLVNGTTIVQELWQRAISYWHVELDDHGVLVAEGALAESYFDDGNRHLFDNAVVALHIDFGAGREGGRYVTAACAPPVMDPNDPALARIRAALPAAPGIARSG